ncbi:MAG: response regulator transcription factor [Steroidobacteraceae bacterium]
MAPHPSHRILLVDDDESLASMLGEILQLHGFAVEGAPSGEAALERLAANPPDLVVLDVMLPGISGFEVLARLRETSELPVIMLTARGTDSERIAGLTSGADDYLAKPFNPLELTARIRAILKRAPPRATAEAARDVLTAGTLRLDLRRFELWSDDRAIALTPAEMRVIEVLMRRQGEVLSRNELTEFALQRQLEPYDRSIDTIMSKLRRKLADAHVDDPRIRGVRSHGYVLEAATAPP